ncbi:HI0074 family nucleotidyltransferase substrate-binding subunit [Kingella negevensis]|uniref:HI0074 family nucleotidyltransferase substrate-binding subunit n=1 Tax=Kingella negevensis TaxID=1522312 RepID=UPI002543417A|nr:HI0074 family nucleotidyltransferase substrate-binding subunit [Kingella negevensis]WII93098.1 HI0074 family nucleotidyltransferase substrate-binding subunit [Kingella negevensis]
MNYLETSALQNAHQSLRDTIAQLAQTEWFEAQTPIIQAPLIAGAIQKFEFVYELSVKMIKRQLKLSALSDDEIDSADFRDILRYAVKQGLIENIDNWLIYQTMRNIASHTYNQTKAQEVYQKIADFLSSSEFLLQQLQQRHPHD